MLKHLLFAAALAVSTPSFCQFSGNALDLDGANDMVVVSTVPALFGTLVSSDFTFEAWVNPRGAIFSRIFYAQFATNNFATVSTGGTNNIYFYVVANGTNYSVATTAVLPQNQWTHVAARWTAASTSVQVFFNGVLQAGAGGGTSSTGTSGLMTFGTRPGGAQYFNGLIDEARLWSEARTACEISSNYRHSITGAQTSLLCNYDFNQGIAAGNNTTVTTLPDLSGNGYNGVLTNFTLTAATSNWVSSTATLLTQGNPLVGITSSQTASVCSGASYTFPDGTVQSNITSTATHASIFTAQNGCDSIINSTVSVLQPSSFSEMVNVCSGSSYTYPDGTTDTSITVSGSHISTLVNGVGCDSLITTQVSVLQPSTAAASAMVCSGSSYTFPDGSVTNNITAQVVEMDTLTNQLGCDSVITTTVDVYPVYNGNDSFAICSGSSYTFYDGTTFTGITASTFHTSTLISINGCDSAVTTSLGIITVDTMVAMLNETLTANASGATFQWLDCGNGYTPIVGDTAQSFTATVNGTYAVAITQNGCTDTSGCFVILSTGVLSASATTVNVYPNPAEGVIYISANTAGSLITLTDASGKVVKQERLTGKNGQLDLSDLSAGIYFLQVESSEGKVVKKIQKN